MAIQDDAKNFLLSALSRAGGDLPSLQMEWLATQGYTRGTIDDRWQAYLSANAYYLPEGLSRLLVGLNRAIGNNWTPNLLFQSGDILLWYDPSDLSTMFKDTAGTQPVTADGDSVALMLDKGQWGGKSLTQVLAAQPDLLAAASWSMSVGGGTAAATNSPEGTLNLTGDGTNSAIGDQSFATVAGHRYKITCDVATNVVALYFGTTQGGTQLATTTFGAGSARTYTFVATGTLTWVRFFRTGAGTTSVSSISLKLVPGYHRVQATGTSMPKYKTGPNPAAAENSPELVSPIDFTSGWSFSGSTVTFDDSNTFTAVAVANVFNDYFEVGKTYAIRINASFTSANLILYNALNATNTIGAVVEDVDNVFTFTAVDTKLNIRPNAAGTVDINSISVKEIPASAPYIHWLLYDGTDDGHATGTVPFNTVTSDGAARRNLLTYPANAAVSPWGFDASTGSGITLTGGLASDGETQFAVFNEGTSNSAHRANQSVSVSAGATLTISAEFKAGTSRYVLLGTIRGGIVIDTDTWTITETVQLANTTTANALLTSLGGGLYRASVTVTHTTDTLAYIIISTALTGTPGTMTPTFTGTSRTAVFTFAQLELGSTATDFQNIGTDEVAVCAGVTKSSDAAAGIVAELSANASANNGAFYLAAPNSAIANYIIAAKGTAAQNFSVTAATYPAPRTDVLTGRASISGDSVRLRVSGIDITADTDDNGTGNFGSYPMYFGRRGGSSLPFNGREYQTVIRSRLLSAAELSSLETFVAAKTGVIL